MEGTTSKNAKLLATAGFLFITMIWGGSFVVMKNSVDLVPPSYLLALRFTLAAAFMALAFPGRMKKLDRGSLTCGLIMGIFLTLAYLFQTYGIKYTTASKNAFITALYVVLVPFLYWKISKKRPGLNQIAAGLVAVIGLALLTLKHESGINLGDALTFLCGICFAVHMICTEEYTKRCDPILLATVQVAAVGVFNWLLAPLLDGPGAFDPSILLQKSLILGLLYLSLILYHCGIPDPDRGTEISQRQYGLPSFIPGSRIRDPVFCDLPGGGPDRKDDPRLCAHVLSPFTVRAAFYGPWKGGPWVNPYL